MKKFIIIIAAIFISVLVGLLFLFSTPSSTPTPSTPMSSALPINWTKHRANPLFLQGAVPEWKFQPGDPFVMQDGGIYKMWFGANEEVRGVTQIGYAESKDGIAWNIRSEPVLRTGGAATYDATVIETPAVVKDERGTYHIWYSSVNKFGGDGDEAVYRIGHAISSDGIRWTKDANNPVLRPAGLHANHWTSWGVFEPKVIWDENAFRLWFIGMNVEAPEYKTVRYRLGYATSPDGSRWEMRAEPLMEFCVGDFNTSAVYNSAFDVVKIGDRYEFFYLGWDCPDVHAVSDGGIRWTKQQVDGKIIPRGSSGAWDGGGVSSPTVLVEEGKLRMWYSGSRVTPLGEFILGVGAAEATRK